MEGPVKNLHINVSKQYFNKYHIIFDQLTRSKSVMCYFNYLYCTDKFKNIIEV